MTRAICFRRLERLLIFDAAVLRGDTVASCCETPVHIPQTLCERRTVKEADYTLDDGAVDAFDMMFDG